MRWPTARCSSSSARSATASANIACVAVAGGDVDRDGGDVRACAVAATLVAARLACGLAAGWIIPLALAFIGDVIPYERRQQVLGRFLSGQILGQLFGQAAGGVLGDLVRLAQRVLPPRRRCSRSRPSRC